MSKNDEPFHRPFKKLKGLEIKKNAEKKQHSVKAAKKIQTTTNDNDLFFQAMKGVKPIESDCITPEPADQDKVIQSISQNLQKQDKEVINTLNALIEGKARFDITCTGEYTEGHVVPLDPNVLKKLKNGEFTTRAYLDLHGHTKEEAHQAIRSFLVNAHAMGDRSLLIIHGRGLKSSTGPVLKEHVVKWLTSGSISHLVLAFCSARSCDGGTGALYVLLRKRPGKSKWKRTL
jgi:DNA-nicking Smr family endonuclease